MFFFKKKDSEPNYFLSPLEGKLIPLNEVSDETFSTGLIGTGFAIQPLNDILYMPFDGIVEMIFPTKHAIGLKDSKGNEYLIHIGVDTVNMNGEGFTTFVEVNKKVKKGTKLIQFPLKKIHEIGLDSVVMIVKTNQTNKTFELKEHKMVEVLDKLIEI